MKSKTLLIILSFVLTTNIKAQENCTEKLYRANILYEKGNINEAIELAKPCTEITNSISNKWQAYRLLSMSYIANNQPNEAEKAVKKMLELNPTYKPSNLKDPIELIKLIKSVKIIPKFSIGMAATAGGNLTFIEIVDTYNGSNYSKNYNSKASWQLGIMFGYHFNEYFSLQSGLIATSRNYSINYKVGNIDLNINEKLAYLNVPLFIRCTSKEFYKFKLFVDAGAYSGKLINSSSDFESYDNTTKASNNAYNLNSETRKNNFEYGILYGIGTIYKYGQINMALDAKYCMSFANITQTDSRYKNENLFYNYYFIDDNIRLNNLAISLSLFYNLNYKIVNKKN